LGQPLLQNPGWVYHACLPKKKRRLRNVGSKGREGTRKKKAQGQRRRATFEPAAAAVVPSGSAVSRACVLDYTKTNRKQEEGKRRLQTNKERGVSEKRKEKEKVLTQNGYYHGSTVVPVVVPVFWSFVPVGWKRNFLYELKGDRKWYEKPESGRTCGPKGSPQGLLGRL
jgi:hypothetical protein